MTADNPTAARPRIVFVATDLSSGGGVNKVIRDLAVLFRRGLHADVTVVNARSDRPSSYAFPDDIPVSSQPRGGLSAYLRLLLKLRGSRPDYVVSSWAQDNILVTLAFLFAPTKVVLVEHSSRHFHAAPVRWLRRLLYRFAWRVIALNHNDLSYYQTFLSNVRLIPNPVTAPRSDRRGEKLIIAVGHLEPVKNFADAIRAMAKTGLEEKGWSLAIIGSGSQQSSLGSLISELRLEKTRIHPPTDDLRSWYDRASILLVTSTSESFSLVLAEAMLAGVIPVAYASDGPSFLLEDFAELRIRMRDLDGLAAKLIEVTEGSGLDTLRSRLAKSVEDRCSPETVLNLWKQQVFSIDEASN